MTRQEAQNNLMNGVRVYQKLPPKKQRIAAILDKRYKDCDRIFRFTSGEKRCLNRMTN